MTPGFMREDLEELYQYEVLNMLKKEGKCWAGDIFQP